MCTYVLSAFVKSARLLYVHAYQAVQHNRPNLLHVPCTMLRVAATEGVLWSEQHQPMSASELAVHRKKVQEVEEWLKWALEPARQSSREVRGLLTHYVCTTSVCVAQPYCSCGMHVKSCCP